MKKVVRTCWGKETESQDGQGPGSVLRTDLWAKKEEFGKQLAFQSMPPPCKPFWITPTYFSFNSKGVQGYLIDIEL